MTDPERFRKMGGDGLERLLFESALDDAPGPDARKKLLSALGTGSAVAFAASQAAAATGKGAAALGAAGTSASLLVKGAVIATLAGGAVFAVATVAERPAPLPRPASVSKPVVRAVPSPPSATPALPQASPDLVAPTPTAQATSRAVKPPPIAIDDVANQRELLDEARAALNADRASVALKALNQYESNFGFGLLGHEETVLSIEAQLALGRRDAAAQRARAYLARYPNGTQASTVTRLLHVIAPPTSAAPTLGENSPSKIESDE